MSGAAIMSNSDTGMIQNIIEKMSDQIVAMVDEILTEKADAMMYEIIKPKIEENMEKIFQSPPVQLEASKMFNREIFPIYKSTLEDFANFNALTKEPNANIDKALATYAQSFTKDKVAAKTALISELKKINDLNVGNINESNDGKMKGGDLKAFLENDENKFKKMDGGKPRSSYLSSNTKKIGDALHEIVGKTMEEYKGIRENFGELEEKFSESVNDRRKNMRIPGSSACKVKNQTVAKTEEKSKTDKTSETQKNLGIKGGRRRRHNKKRTYKKRK
jgi:hypothetical protein